MRSTATEEVVKIIANICLKEISEIFNLEIMVVNSLSFMNGKDTSIKFQGEQNSVSMQLRLVCNAGTNISEICCKLQELLMKDIKQLTGLSLNTIDIKLRHILIRKSSVI